jgi:hypothetical protein
MITLCKIYATKYENPYKMNNFLIKCNLLKLTEEEVENLSRPINIEETGNAVKKTTQNEVPVQSNLEIAIKINNVRTRTFQLKYLTPCSLSRDKSTGTIRLHICRSTCTREKQEMKRILHLRTFYQFMWSNFQNVLKVK